MTLVCCLLYYLSETMLLLKEEKQSICRTDETLFNDVRGFAAAALLGLEAFGG